MLKVLEVKALQMNKHDLEISSGKQMEMVWHIEKRDSFGESVLKLERPG